MFVSAYTLQKKAVDEVMKGDPAKEQGVLLAIDTAKAKKSDNTVHYVRIRIGTDIAKKAELKPGMLADLQFDPTDGMGLISRVPDDGSRGGWKLAGLKRNVAGDTPLQLRYTWHEGQPSIPEPRLMANVHATKKGIQFKFPDEVSFDKLAVSEKRSGSSDGAGGEFRRRSTDRKAAPMQ